LIDTICYVIDYLDFPYDKDEVNNYLYFHRQLDPSKTCPGKLDYNQVLSDVADELKNRGDSL